eukprot:SAG31_NODE_3728_length_3948_cov_1.597504_2_plen_63_part_00
MGRCINIHVMTFYLCLGDIDIVLCPPTEWEGEEHQLLDHATHVGARHRDVPQTSRLAQPRSW